MPARDDILRCLPHREPFLFISGGLLYEGPGVGRAEWRISGSESFLDGHFPGHPVVPGVLVIEALAQLSGLVALAGEAAGAPPEDKDGGGTKVGHLAHADIRFSKAVAPPATIRLWSRTERSLGRLRQFEVRALVGTGESEELVARGTLTLALPGGDG